MVAMSALYYRR